MIPLLCTVTLAWAVLAGVIQAFSEGIFYGFQTVVAVWVGHWITSLLLNFSMWVHQQTLSDSQKSMMSLFGEAAAPRTWKVLGVFWGVTFLVIANIFIIERF